MSAHAASAALRIRQDWLRPLPCLNGNPCEKTALHIPASSIRGIFVKADEALLAQGEDNEAKSTEQGCRNATWVRLPLPYGKAGIDIAYTDAIKKEMSKHLETANSRGACAAECEERRFSGVKDPQSALADWTSVYSQRKAGVREF